jgi:hypothetical protein
VLSETNSTRSPDELPSVGSSPQSTTPFSPA